MCTREVPFGQVTSPVFLKRQILEKIWPGAICVPSKTVTSLTKRESSFSLDVGAGFGELFGGKQGCANRYAGCDAE